jgi:hypothetical protein
MPKGRNPNIIDTVQITISTTRPIQVHLERLVSTGFYGKNPAEAAERLLAQAIKELSKDFRNAEERPAVRRKGVTR